MSWQRANWERTRTRGAHRTPYPLRNVSQREGYQAPFPLVRRVDISQTPGFNTLIPSALERIRNRTGNQALLRGAHDAGPAVTLLSIKAMQSQGLKYLPSDKDAFLQELANKTGTSAQRLIATIRHCGFFGRRNSGAIHIGLSLDEATTDTITSEGQAAIEIIWPDVENPPIPGYPHVSLGQLVLTEAEKVPFKREINELAQELGSLLLRPTSTTRE